MRILILYLALIGFAFSDYKYSPSKNIKSLKIKTTNFKQEYADSVTLTIEKSDSSISQHSFFDKDNECYSFKNIVAGNYNVYISPNGFESYSHEQSYCGNVFLSSGNTIHILTDQTFSSKLVIDVKDKSCQNVLNLVTRGGYNIIAKVYDSKKSISYAFLKYKPESKTLSGVVPFIQSSNKMVSVFVKSNSVNDMPYGNIVLLHSKIPKSKINNEILLRIP
ncbi:MAG: hypothetical protein HQL32_07270 [Planctomycetes bacterium]|nr:hypothetical protein [Planctomycetota bacterium]